VPVVTCRGQSFAGRVAASLLNAIGLPELITESLAAYEAMALKLARDRALLDQIKSTLRANRHSATLFDGDTFRRNIEKAYCLMMEKARRGEAPAGFDVAL
jgi:predicted O-linked N-acetylglucosamine transferase (SPINDLY family)